MTQEKKVQLNKKRLAKRKRAKVRMQHGDDSFAQMESKVTELELV